MRIFSINFTLIALLMNSAILAENNPYKEQATKWAASLFTTDQQLAITPEELQLVANLLYFSYCRSAINLRASQNVLDALNLLWKGFENITATQLNPSLAIPHMLDCEQQKKIMIRAWDLVAQHRIIGAAYAHTVEYIINGDCIKNNQGKQAILTIRSAARNVVAQALMDAKKHLANLYDGACSLQNTLNKRLTEHAELANKSFSIVDYIWSYIPQLAVHAFVEADKLQKNMHREAWHALQTLLNIDHYTWKTIEQARALFYKTHYEALYILLEQMDIKQEYRKIVFNEHGIIMPAEHGVALPSPQDLF